MSLLKFPIVVIQKFWYHGNVTSYFYCLFICFALYICSRGSAEKITKEFKEICDRYSEILKNTKNIQKLHKVGISGTFLSRYQKMSNAHPIF